MVLTPATLSALTAASTLAMPSLEPDSTRPFGNIWFAMVTSSGMTKSLMANLPCYREGIDDKLRGLEVGLAHGYFFYGPFVTLGPLRASPIAPYAGLMSAIGLVLICSRCHRHRLRLLLWRRRELHLSGDDRCNLGYRLR